jgi:hypothetical protein
MDQDAVGVEPLTLREVAESVGITVEKALGILHASEYRLAREAGDTMDEEAQGLISDGVAVDVTAVGGGYRADFLVECSEGDAPLARRAVLVFSRHGYSDTCWSCGDAATCRWSFRVIGAKPYDVVERAAVSVLTEWCRRAPSVDHAHLCGECAEKLGPAFVLILEKVIAEEVEADRLYRLQTAQKRLHHVAKAPAPSPRGMPRSLSRTDAPTPSERRLIISDKLAAALALTPHRENASPLGDLFEVVIDPALGPMGSIRLVHDDWTAYGTDGNEVDLDDARIPVLRNVAFGACDLLADSGGGAPSRVVEPSDKPLPLKLIRPSQHIRVPVNTDLRALVIEILEGNRQYETVTAEAIFVRGHWTHQPCGDGARERKVIWRQPHYRGKGHRGGRSYAFVEAR